MIFTKHHLLRKLIFLRSLFNFKMIISGSIWQSAVAANITVRWHLSAPVVALRQFSLLSDVFPYTSKYIGVSSLFPISSFGQSYSFHASLTVWRKSVILCSNEASSFWVTKVLALITKSFLFMNFCSKPLVPLKDGLMGWMIRSARSMMFCTVTASCRSHCSSTNCISSVSFSDG